MQSTRDSANLTWQSEAGYQTATDSNCLYIRETPGSRIAGLTFCLILVVVGVAGAIWAFAQPRGDSWILGLFASAIALTFLLVMIFSVRKDPWMIVYDRAAGEIRYRNKVLKAANVRSIMVREIGTGSQSLSNRTVFAELHNGPAEALGPTGPVASAHRWAKSAAEWMGLEYKS